MMPTPLRKPVVREVELEDGRTLVVTMSRAGISTREKFSRTEFGPVSYEAIESVGAKIEAREIRKEKAREKKAGRGLIGLEK